LYRGINDFKKGYQPRTDTAKDENGDVVTDCHSILVRWRNHFSQLLNVHVVNDVRQTLIHTAEPLVPEHAYSGCAGSNSKPWALQDKAEALFFVPGFFHLIRI
jgi:hypothetical protein